MGLFARGRSQLPYDMFALARSAEDAKRYERCERIYHKGQELAWDGRETLAMLIAKHGKPSVDPETKEALKRIFAIILWGELAAWKISAQLASELVPLEAKMAATSQAHDEARHFYTMYDYLRELDYLPERLDRAPEALLEAVLSTKDVARKILGMQLLVEAIALAIFQEVREREVEPVLTELMTYYERDEARHVGLGIQYLPALLKGMTEGEVTRLFLFQARLIVTALWEAKSLEKDFRKLGIHPRRIVSRAQAKQQVALEAAFAALGWKLEDSADSFPFATIDAAIEVLFPTEENEHSLRKRLDAARRVFGVVRQVPADALAVHGRHRIRTARGVVAEVE